MNWRFFRILVVIAAAWSANSGRLALGAPSNGAPNVIFVLADDLGYGDPGCYGQKKIKTPNLDRMATEGMRFTQGYCGTSVCAPSRCTLMTGLHLGHTAIRANREIQPEGQEPLPAGTFTVGKLFQSAGYKTATFGKWGLGFVDTTGVPDKMGIETFFGYNCQRQAHNYYPDHLWRNRERVALDGKTYSHDLIVKEAFQWLRQNGRSPFFMYLAVTIPHGNYQVPDLGPYANESWPEPMKKYASMVTRLDGDVGRLFKLLKELGIDERTLVFFTSDNGADNPQALKLFQSNGPLRGGKRTLYEGGIREPSIARWPGHVKPGAVNDTPWVFYDFLPTVAELIGRPLPAGVKTDGISIVPALLGRPMPKREYLYWELREGPFLQAVRMGDWKGIRKGPGQPIELYDLAKDLSEKQDVASEHPDVAGKIGELMKQSHVENPIWPDSKVGKEKIKKGGKGKKKAKA